MSRNNLMKSLVGFHAIANENIDEEALDVQEPTEDLEVNEHVTFQDTPEETVDAVIDESAEDEVVKAQDDVAIEALFLEVDRNLKRALALEDLAEQLDETVQGDGQGISPVEAQMVVTASELDDESGSQIATESFYMDTRVATESLRDTIAEKAAMLKEVVMSGIDRARRAVLAAVSDTIEKVNGCHLKLISYAKKADILSDFSGQQITDEKVLKRLRDHMPMDSDGNSSLDFFFKSSGTDLVRSITSLVNYTNKLNTEMDPSRPDRMMNSIASFFKEVEKLKNGRVKNINVNVTTPDSFEVDTLLALPVVKNVATADYVPGSGSQTYRVVTKDEINRYVDQVTLIRSELNTIKNIFHREHPTNQINSAIQYLTNRKDAELFKMVKLRYKMHLLMSSIVSKLASDATVICNKAARHAVMLTAASFQVAGAPVSNEDTAADPA